MKPNENLKSMMLELVEKQLSKNNPAATRETFERLTASGYTKVKAKESIATVLLETICDMMKKQKPFDEEEFASRLSKLKGLKNEY